MGGGLFPGPPGEGPPAARPCAGPDRQVALFSCRRGVGARGVRGVPTRDAGGGVWGCVCVCMCMCVPEAAGQQRRVLR